MKNYLEIDYGNGFDANTERPQNLSVISIALNFDRMNPSGTPSLPNSRFRIVKNEAKKLIERLETGSWFIGIPCNWYIEDKDGQDLIFEGYLDPTDNMVISNNDIEISFKRLQSVEWFKDQLRGFDFETMYNYKFFNPNTGKQCLTKEQFVFMPYVVSTIPQYMGAIQSLITESILVYQMDGLGQKTVSDVGAIIPFNWGGVLTVIADVVTLFFLIDLAINATIDMILYLIQPIKYTAGMYVKDLLIAGCDYLGYNFKSDNIFDNPKNDDGSFNPFHYLCIFPRKYQPPIIQNTSSLYSALLPSINTGLKGYLSPDPTKQRGYPMDNFEVFSEKIRKAVNGKFTVTKFDGDDRPTIILERWDYTLKPVKTWKIPDLRNDFSGRNTADLKANIEVRFQTNLNDRNTIDEWKGTAFIVTHTFIDEPSNQALRLLNGGDIYSIEYCRAKRKEKFTLIEEIFLIFTELLDSVLNILIGAVIPILQGIGEVFDGIDATFDLLKFIGIDEPDFLISAHESIDKQTEALVNRNKSFLSDKIKKRIGMWNVENDMFDSDYFAVIDPSTITSDPKTTRLHPDNDFYLSGKYWYSKFFYINSFVPTNKLSLQQREIRNDKGVLLETIKDDRPNANQYIQPRQLKNTPFRKNDFKYFLNSNFAIKENPDGTVDDCRVDTVNWFPEQGRAEIQYNINKLYEKNLQILTSEPDGQ